MFHTVKRWIESRKQLSALRLDDARELLSVNPRTAYYDAQRLAARSRFRGDQQSFIHWASVAAEVARISNNPMDIAVIRAIVDEERRLADMDRNIL